MSENKTDGNGKVPPCRIGLYICHCGINISKMVDVVHIAKEMAGHPDVVVSREYKFMCSEPGQDLIIKDIEGSNLTRIVVAACSPLMHEPTFRTTVERGGLNRYLFEMVNIREQCSWVTVDRHEATSKARALINGALARVKFHEPLEMRRVTIGKRVLIVGGGIAGIEAALQVADAGYEVVLVEKEESIGGHMAKFDKTFPTLDCSACILTPKMVAVGTHPRIRLLTFAEVEEVQGYIGNFKVKVRKKARFVNPDLCNSCGSCYEVCPSQPYPLDRQLIIGDKVFKAGPRPTLRLTELLEFKEEVTALTGTEAVPEQEGAELS
jgi:heterodisulfide reductase subunit A